MSKFKKRFENPFLYAEYELELADKYISPRFKSVGISLKGKRIIDVGCGWGGCSVAFAEAGCTCMGFDLSKHQIGIAKKFSIAKKKKIRFFLDDICNLKCANDRFDIVILRDVMEYVDKPLVALLNCKKLLKDNGILYVTFPPWYSPYGGNQHHPKSITKFMPYVHLLPKPIFFGLLNAKEGLMFKEDNFLKEISKIRNNKMSVSKFEKLVRKSGLKIYRKKLFLSRPAFKIRMGLPVIEAGFLGKIPILRELTTTGAEYFLRK